MAFHPYWQNSVHWSDATYSGLNWCKGEVHKRKYVIYVLIDFYLVIWIVYMWILWCLSKVPILESIEFLHSLGTHSGRLL